MVSRISRRHVLAGAAGGLVLLRNPGSVWGYQANERLNVALVGVGGRGTWFVDTIPRMQNVVALCDVDSRRIAEASGRWKEAAARLEASAQEGQRRSARHYQRQLDARPKAYADFRVMLDEMAKEIDAVIVATPDHTHGVISAAALRAGKPVFCEKPLTRTLHESRALRELARRQKVATSMGNQGTAAGPFRRALELIRGGTIGEVKEVHVWNDSGGGDRKEPPGPAEPVPDYLEWDLWLGPAAHRPYHRDWLKRNLWRDFGTCQLGNWASHSANLAFMALKVQDLWLSPPSGGAGPVIRVQATCSGINRLSFPRWELIRWEIPARAEFPPITFTWYNGDAPGRRELVDSLRKGASEEFGKLIEYSGAHIVGTKGRIHATGHNATFRLLPEDPFRGVQRGRPEQVEASRGHEEDFFEACRGGKPAWANFDYASALNEFLMLGNVATQFEGRLEFDPVAMRIVNHPEADALLRSEYREGWRL